MVEVHLISYGWLIIPFVYGLSAFGGILGILLTTKAGWRHGRRRLRLLIYAALALGGAGVWHAQTVALLGLSAAGPPVRFDPVPLGAGLAAVVVLVGAGLIVVCWGSHWVLRVGLGSLLIATGVAVAHQAGVAALRVGTRLGQDPSRARLALALALAAALTFCWTTVMVRALRSAVVAALAFAALISAAQYATMWSVRGFRAASVLGSAGPVTPAGPFDPSTSDIVGPGGRGLDALTLGIPLALVGTAAIVMLAYFAFGSATLRDLQAIYLAPDRTEDIEPWLVEEIRLRIIAGPPIRPIPSIPPGIREPI